VWVDALLESEFPEMSEFEPLGRGGFASVYSASHPQLGRIALKVLTGADHWDVDASGRRSFWQQVETETKAIGSLSAAPTIVTLHTSGRSRSGWPYLVMELCPGGSLKDVIARRKATGEGMPLDAIVEVGVAVGTALATAHDSRILHLDVKPANILVSRFSTFQLSDFGIARSINDAPPGDEESFLTPHYAAPELWDATSRPLPASDVFALGVTLYQMATLRRPFEGSSGTALAERVRAERPAPVDRPDLPAALCELIAACLEKNPASRPDPKELVALLRGLSLEEADDTRTLAATVHADREPSKAPHEPMRPPPPATATPTPPPFDGELPSLAPDAPPAPEPPPLVAPGPDAGARPDVAASDDSSSRGTSRLWLAAGSVALVALLLAVVVALATSSDDPTNDNQLATDDELRAGADVDLFAAPDPRGSAVAPTAERAVPGVAVDVEVGPVADGRASLTWVLDEPPDGADYVVLAARFELDPATGRPAASPSEQGLLSASGAIAGEDEALARLTPDERSLQVDVAPSEVRCFSVILVTADAGIPSASRPCAPAAPPAAPDSVELTPGSDGTAEVTWNDRSTDESRFRVLAIKDQHGREEVVEAVVVEADETRATVPLHPNACYLVRAENAANTLPLVLAGLPRPGSEGTSRDDACS
jgi:serine/threonine protein kinase